MRAVSGEPRSKRSESKAPCSDELQFVGRARCVLRRIASTADWRNIVAFLCALAAFGAANGGLFYYARPLQVGIFTGIVAGMIASGVGFAALAAVLAASVGLIALPAPALPFESLTAWDLSVAPVAAAVAATFVRFMGSRWRIACQIALWTAMAAIIVNLWATSLSWNTVSLDDPSLENPFPSLITQLQGYDIGAHDDSSAYIATYQSVRNGVPYYQAFMEAHEHWSGGYAPSKAYAFRQPALFELWAAIPGDGYGIVYGLLVLATGAIIASFHLASTFVKPPLALPACCAVGAQMLHSLTDRSIVFAESWAVCFALLALGAVSISTRSKKHKTWAIVAVSFALAAALTRLIAVPMLIAGFVGALYFRRSRFDVYAWGIGLAVYAASYLVHTVVVWEYLSPGPTSIVAGSFDNVVMGLKYGIRFLGGAQWFPLLTSLFGVAALAFIPDGPLRNLVALPVGLMIASWLVFSNNARSEFVPGLVENYWGKLVVPVLYATSPALLSAIPGMSRNTQQAAP